MNAFALNVLLNHYAKNVPTPEEVNGIWANHEDQLKSLTPEQLDLLKPKYPTLVPAIDQIKARIVGTLVNPK